MYTIYLSIYLSIYLYIYIYYRYIDQEWSRRFCFAKNEVPVEFQHPPAASSIFLKWQHHLWRYLEIRDPPPQSGGNPTKASQIGWIRGTNFKKESIKMKVKDWRRSSNIHCADREWLSRHHHPALICQQNLHVSVLTRDKGWVPSSTEHVQWTTAALLSLISHTPPFHGMCRHTGCPRRVQRALLKELCWVHSGRSALGEFVWWLLDTVGSKHFFTLGAAIIPRPTAYHVGPCRKPGFVDLACWRIDRLTINSSCTARAWPGFSRHWGAQCRLSRLALFNCKKSSDVSRVWKILCPPVNILGNHIFNIIFNNVSRPMDLMTCYSCNMLWHVIPL